MTDTEMKADDRYEHVALKTMQKTLQFPQLELPLGSMEINFVLSAHEAIVNRFKLNKRFIEKELSGLFAQAKKMKKTCKDKADLTLQSID